MSSDKMKEKSVLTDKQKFGKDEGNERLEHEAEEKLEHMGERSQQTSKPGSQSRK
jgi:hypothetical protein